MHTLIKLAGVSVRYGRKTILDDIDFSLVKGDFTAVTGPNGGGKTTLLKVMLKLLKPTSGSVEYYSADGSPAKRLAIGYLPQKSRIDTNFPITAGEAIRQGQIRGLFHRYTPHMKERYDEVCRLCGIGEFETREVGALSGGQLQRTLLARAIVSRPEVLVLDEPLSYVDKSFEYQIYDIMETLSKSTTILLVSHEMSVISSMANRHVIVDHGIHLCHSERHWAKQCE